MWLASAAWGGVQTWRQALWLGRRGPDTWVPDHSPSCILPLLKQRPSDWKLGETGLAMLMPAARCPSTFVLPIGCASGAVPCRHVALHTCRECHLLTRRMVCALLGATSYQHQLTSDPTPHPAPLSATTRTASCRTLQLFISCRACIAAICLELNYICSPCGALTRSPTTPRSEAPHYCWIDG